MTPNSLEWIGVVIACFAAYEAINNRLYTGALLGVVSLVLVLA